MAFLPVISPSLKKEKGGVKLKIFVRWSKQIEAAVISPFKLKFSQKKFLLFYIFFSIKACLKRKNCTSTLTFLFHEFRSGKLPSNYHFE